MVGELDEISEAATGGLSPEGERQALFRAVRPAELKDITVKRAFRNPEGIETKYFSATREGAEQYAEMADRAFADGPYAIVETSMPKSQITPAMKAVVEAGIPTVVVPTDKLNELSGPVIREKR